MANKPALLVTGGSGMLGGNLVRALAGQGYSVKAFYRPGDDDRYIRDEGIEKITGDICDVRALARVARGCQAVFHTAGNVSFRKSDRRAQQRVNVQGTRAVIEACRLAGVRRMVHTSTVNTLGIPHPDGAVGDEETPFDFGSCEFHYALTKKLAEDIALRANDADLDVVVVNPGTVFGPGDVNANAGSYILAIARVPVFFYPAGGTNCVHVDAVTAGHIAAYERGRPGERYILGGENLTYHRMFSTIAGILDRPRPRMRLPTRPSVFIAAMVEKICEMLGLRSKIAAEAALAGGKKFFYSSEKARQELDLPDIPFQRAVRDAVAWYRKEGYLPEV